MPESDILLSIDGDTTPLKTALKNTLKWANKEAAAFMKFTQFRGIEVTRGMKLPKMPPVTDPFVHYRKIRGRMRGMDIEPLREKKPPEAWFKKTMKLFKIDLFWRWIKGTWSVLTRYVPLLRSLADIFSAAIGLILTALILPFLPGILKVLTWLLDRSVSFFSWMQENSKLVTTLWDDIKRIIGDIVALSPSGFLKLLGEIGLKIYNTLCPPILQSAISFVAEKLGILKDKIVIIAGWIAEKLGLGHLFEKLGLWIGEKGLTGILGKAVSAIAGFANPLLWTNIIFSLLHGALTLLLGPDNPITKFVDFMAQATDIVGFFIAAIKDVIGLVIGGPVGAIKEKFMGIGETLFGNILGLERGFMRMANGGIVTSPTIAMIGEAGPEAVIPLDQMRGGTTINVQGIVDERKFKEIIRSVVAQEMGRTYAVRGGVY